MQTLLLEGMDMNAENYWQLFMETGAPEMYILYQQALKMGEKHVSDHSGHCSAGHGLQ